MPRFSGRLMLEGIFGRLQRLSFVKPALNLLSSFFVPDAAVPLQPHLRAAEYKASE
jgi:hypothetical protein